MGIGMRSLTVKTFDNQSVIIPNAEVVGNAFTNWTHNDRILRTLLVIGIGYDSDPHKAQAILEEVFTDNKGVLTDPAPSSPVLGIRRFSHAVSGLLSCRHWPGIGL